MSEIHIKPCPFCGSENISFNAFSISSDAYVLCEQCNASIEISVPWDDLDEKEHDKVCLEKLSVLWNKRASERNQSELNKNQQIVLDWLKTLPLFPISAIHLLEAGKNVQKNVKNAYENFDKKEEAEVLQAFSQWMEQEEK